MNKKTRGVTTMKKETEKLIKLISSAEDSDRALLTAFAILVEYLEKREDAKKGDNSVLLVNCKGNPS
jgi:hypothetical protein